MRCGVFFVIKCDGDLAKSFVAAVFYFLRGKFFGAQVLYRQLFTDMFSLLCHVLWRRGCGGT